MRMYAKNCTIVEQDHSSDPIATQPPMTGGTSVSNCKYFSESFVPCGTIV